MRALGTYILAGRLQAIAVISFLSMLSLLVPPLVFLVSGVPVALVTLRRGGQTGLEIIFGCMVLIYLCGLVLKIQSLMLVGLMASIWLPVYLCSMVHRITQRPAMMSLAAAAIAVAFIVLTHALIGDVEAWWRELMQEVLDAGLPQGMTAQYREAMDLAPRFMNAVVASGMTMSLVLTGLLGRWWQSVLFNPGGFQSEFHGFSLPKPLAFAVLICMGLALVPDGLLGPVLRDVIVVMVVVYLLQGIAAVHRTVGKRGLSSAWLVGLYCLLALLPQVMVLMVAWMGLTDSLLTRREPGQGQGED